MRTSEPVALREIEPVAVEAQLQHSQLQQSQQQHPQAQHPPPHHSRSQLSGAATALTRIEDSLTLSSAAMARVAAAAHPRFGTLSVSAHGNPELAEQLASNYAHTVHTPLYDKSGMEAGGPMRYSATGEPVTPESEARYKQQGESLQTASFALYKEEKAKGTDPADVFDKLIALADAQSAEFRTITKWELTAADWG